MNKIFLSVLAASVLLVACNQKESSKVRIKKMSSARGYFTEYTYSPDGNIATSLNSDGVKTTYKFSGNTVAENMTDSARSMFITSMVYLNSKGIADSTTAKDEHENYTKTYKHDANGYIIESKDYVSGKMSDMSNSVVKDGNQVQATVLDSVEQPIFTIYFEYYADKPNTLGYENYGMKYLGSDSKNLMKKFVQVLPKGDTIRVNNIHYHFDKDGRVSQKVIYDARGMMADSSTFTY
jgi:hypothetical protein